MSVQVRFSSCFSSNVVIRGHGHRLIMTLCFDGEWNFKDSSCHCPSWCRSHSGGDSVVLDIIPPPPPSLQHPSTHTSLDLSPCQRRLDVGAKQTPGNKQGEKHHYNGLFLKKMKTVYDLFDPTQNCQHGFSVFLLWPPQSGGQDCRRMLALWKNLITNGGVGDFGALQDLRQTRVYSVLWPLPQNSTQY